MKSHKLYLLFFDDRRYPYVLLQHHIRILKKNLEIETTKETLVKIEKVKSAQMRHRKKSWAVSSVPKDTKVQRTGVNILIPSIKLCCG